MKDTPLCVQQEAATVASALFESAFDPLSGAMVRGHRGLQRCLICARRKSSATPVPRSLERRTLDVKHLETASIKHQTGSLADWKDIKVDAKGNACLGATKTQ